LWFVEPTANKIGRVTVSGTVTEFAGVTNLPQAIARGPDGNVWFTEYANACNALYCTAANATIGKITPDGTITEFAVPTAESFLYAITAGPDGNVWFTESQGGVLGLPPAGGKIARITPAGVITEFDTPTMASAPAGIAAGADGNLWFTESAVGKFGQI